MKKSVKYLVFALVVILSLVCLVGCGKATKIDPPRTDDGVEPIKPTGTVTVTRDGDKLHASVKTDLMDGVILKVAVDAYNGSELAHVVYTKTCDEFYADFTIEESWPEKVYVSLVCQPEGDGKQSKEVTKIYGKKFQNLAGDNIVWTAQKRMFVVQTMVEL